MLLSLLSLVSIVASVETRHYFATPFALMFAFGYGYVAALVIAEQFRRRREVEAGIAPPSSGTAATSEQTPMVTDLAT
jgi:hypothetical protein